ncbi:MAG: hypothetical protein WCG80_00795 [Spirochaetales bacterium]
MAKRPLLLACLLLIFGVPLSGQADDPGGEDPQVLELRTSGYYELVARARALGLPETGGVSELRQSIATKLGLVLPSVEKNAGKTLTIDSAQEAGVMNVDVTGGGKLIHLSGDLQVTLEDLDKKVTHIIEADELWYDQDSGEMTARGNVKYTMIRESSRETFRGESLTFRLSDAQGVFYGGSSDRSRSVADQNLVFRYQGDAIRRSAGDVVVLDSGTITSSLGEDPYYHVQARKIWVLRPGEWGLQDAVLYLGHIPVFWFPFYFQPSDEMVFNPVLTFSDATGRRGTSLQTTTYVFGQKKKDAAPLSFLQVDDSSTVDKGKVLRGLYLTRGKPAATTVPSSWSLKVLADFYSRLGMLVGVDANLPGLGSLKTFQVTMGMGITRNVTSDGATYSASPFDSLLAPGEQSHWNSSAVLGVTVPFRWGGTLELSDSWWNLSGQFDSDPVFWGDLTSGRSENFSMLALLGLGPATKTAARSNLGSLVWKMSATLPSTLPGLQASAQGTWNWDVKKSVPAKLAEDPQSSFFVPGQLFLPSLSLQWGGDLLKVEATKVSLAESQLPDLLPLSPSPQSPESVAEAAPPGASSDLPELLSSALLASLTVPGAPATWTQSLTWNVNPLFRLDTRFDNSRVLQAQDSNSEIQSSRWTGSWDGRMAYNGSLSNSGFTVGSTVSLHQQMQQAWYLSPSTAPAQKTASDLQDSQQTNSLAQATITAAWKPLGGLHAWQDSSLGYTLGTRLWENKDGKDSFFDLSTASILANQFTAQANWQALDTLKLGFSWRNVLPPQTTNLSGGASLDYQIPLGHLTTRTQWKNTGADWKSDPWESSLEVTPLEGLTFKESFVYDLVKYQPQSSTTQVTWAGLALQYRQLQTLGYHFDPVTRRWVATGVTDFLPQELNTTYSLTVPLQQSWENRQSVSGNFSFSWPINLQQISQMPVSFNYGLQYKLYRFVDLQISQSVVNRTVFLYFPWLIDSLGVSNIQSVNFLTDVWDSLSFWDDVARHRAGFKMSSLSVSLVHYLEDWQLKIAYSGSPQLAGTKPQFQWTGTLSVTAQWLPVPELKTQLQWDKDGKLSIPRNSP